jgi:hypothetical protein
MSRPVGWRSLGVSLGLSFGASLGFSRAATPAALKSLAWVLPLIIALALQLGWWLLPAWLAIWWGWGRADQLKIAGLLSARTVRALGNGLLALLGLVAVLPVGPFRSAEFQVGVLMLLCACLISAHQLRRPGVLQEISLVVVVFLTGALFIFTTQAVLLLAACAWLMAYVLFTVSASHGVGWAQLAMPSGRVLGYFVVISLLAALVFAVIPRVPMQLAAPINLGASVSNSGVTDALRVSDLGPVELDATADFAIRFEKGHPNQDVYWAVHTLERWHNGQWQKGPLSEAYRITGQPISAIDERAVAEPDYIYTASAMRSARAVNLPILGWVGLSTATAIHPSNLVHSFVEPGPLQRKLLAATRHSTEPLGRLGQWAIEDRLQHPSDAAWVQAVLKRFQQSYRYSLSAQAPAGESALDHFFFEGQQGHCSHFTAALAEMLRVNGIPVRVVSGYLGADWNAAGEFWTLRRSQAHLWVEAILDSQHFLRIDPTQGVMPADNTPTPSQRVGLGPVQDAGRGQQWLRRLYYQAEFFNLQLTSQILGYGYLTEPEAAKRSRSSFDAFTQDGLLALMGLFGLSGVMVFLGLRWSMRSTRSGAVSPVLVRHLSRSGFERQPGETLLQFARRCDPTNERGLTQLAQRCLALDFSSFVDDGPAAYRRELMRDILALRNQGL